MKTCTVRQESPTNEIGQAQQRAWKMVAVEYTRRRTIGAVIPVAIGPCHYLEAVQTLAWLGTNTKP